MIPKTKKHRNLIRYVGAFALLLILASFIYQWNNGLTIDNVERSSAAGVIAIIVMTFIPQRKKESN
ncbi:hypothetical protein CN941_15710 [Bacillus cereus]|uniref:hypothetical protein n=1 Tax=Bacillus nitratireducens TaxID=2026193 RepID=UPI000BF26E0A|nr:hypothetical protein [Bacillus nitratireducens]PEZ83859.1 hypothetical protein CN374_28260 [Bacillus cereus]PFA36401.1 hypothetical protein CN390_00775 [Bacillus cereus]PFB96415.1 hypothetical protein CN296_18020 [Bacillus cereus]PFE70041.1 hypothetical protein CN316_13575 [Bacillus cereus]PGL31990.1 hypothetical protein CN930_23790 [Bacillus cereus]